MDYPKFTPQHRSLLAKYLTKDIFNQLKDKKTSNGFTLEDLIISGVKNPDSSIGTYAGDHESYKLFAPLLDKIIEDYHHYDVRNIAKRDLDISKLDITNNNSFDQYILSTRIRVARNLKDIPLGAAISKDKRKFVEHSVSECLLDLKGDLKGIYYPLDNLTTKNQQQLIKDHFLFKQGDRFLDAAGLNRDWPHNRGIFHNLNKTFLVWINEEDQLRIISMEKGGDIKSVFQRLVDAIVKLEQKIDFSYDKHLGYITSCPTNLGTALRASVHIKLPNLEKNIDLFDQICSNFHLQIRGVDGEHSKSKGSVYDISNKRRLGVSEIECIKDLYDGVTKLIQTEQSLEVLG